MIREAFEAIRQARETYLRCCSHAEGLVAGIENDAAKHPVALGDSPFGRWYFAATCSPLKQLPSFRVIGATLKSVHDQYDALYRLARAGHADQAEQRLNALVDASQELLLQLDTLERDLQSLQAQQ